MAGNTLRAAGIIEGHDAIDTVPARRPIAWQVDVAEAKPVDIAPGYAFGPVLSAKLRDGTLERGERIVWTGHTARRRHRFVRVPRHGKAVRVQPFVNVPEAFEQHRDPARRAHATIPRGQPLDARSERLGPRYDPLARRRAV